MTNYGLEDRLQENQSAVTEYWENHPLIFGLALVAAGVLIGWYIFGVRDGLAYSTNVFTEGLALGATVLILDRRAARRERESYRKQLLREARVPASSIAVAALDALEKEGWWEHLYKSLSETGLERAQWENVKLMATDLHGLYMPWANLRGADIFATNLQMVNLESANLEDASLMGSNLRQAFLSKCNLRNAVLIKVSLQDADLSYADLRGANLREADLRGARLKGAQFDENTQLPDSELLVPNWWSQGTDMTSYTG